MPDYQKTIIYKICHKDPKITDIYIGSTCNFAKRKCDHKIASRNPLNSKHHQHLYQFIREHDGFDEFEMVMIDEYPCQNKREKEARERHWIEQLKPTLNQRNPFRPAEEWRKENKEYIKEENQKYREANKETIRQRKKQYREKNDEKIKQHKKQYREDNKEKIAQHDKEYRESHKEQRQRKEQCMCGSVYAHVNKAKHERTAKHQNFIISN